MESKGKILFIIAFENFRDEELFETEKVIKAAGFSSMIASTQKGIAKGSGGSKVEVEKTIVQVNVADYLAVVFVGGNGAKIFFDDPIAQAIAEEAFTQGKVDDQSVPNRRCASGRIWLR